MISSISRNLKRRLWSSEDSMTGLEQTDSAPVVDSAEELERRLERKDIAFEALFRLFEKIGTTFDIDTIIKLLLMTIVGQLGLRRIAFFIRNERSARLDLYHSIGLARDAVFPSFSIESGLIRCMEGAEGVVSLQDLLSGERPGDADDSSIGAALLENGFSHACDLRDKETLFGVMAFSRKVNGQGFSDFDRELLVMMAKVASITIRNASLYQSVLRSKNEVENFARMKKEFIDHTSHELRTPLTVLRSSLWSIEAVDEEAELMDMARDAVLRLEDNVEHILSMNEMDMKGGFIDPMVAEISVLVISACREMAERLEEKEILLDIKNEIGEVYLTVDPIRLNTVIGSMLENSLGSIGCRGSIKVRLERRDGVIAGDGRTEISAWDAVSGDIEPGEASSESGSWIVISIADDGRGIPSGEIESIGRPFVRASNSATGEVRGLGVGLSVAQKIIAAHGGHIFCTSIEGDGAEFSIWLPSE
jgi:signal transduction histidine kinase